MAVIVVARNNFWEVHAEEFEFARRRAMTDSLMNRTFDVQEEDEKMEESAETSTQAPSDTDSVAEGSCSRLCWSDESDDELVQCGPPGNWTKAMQSQSVEDTFTSVIFRHLPKKFTQALLIELLRCEGFASVVDFLYVPSDFKKGVCLSYAIVNFATNSDASSAMAHFQDFQVEDRELALEWSASHQGRDALVEKYRNSAVMHHSVPTVYKPLVFSAGKQVIFPPPTESITPPPMFGRKASGKTRR
jgi:hypothetical protein